MSIVHQFTFNPFQENTFVIYDETKEGIIIDPGCYTNEEKQQLQSLCLLCFFYFCLLQPFSHNMLSFQD
jgi:hypothetical protein